MRPHHADSLMNFVLGADVDLSQFNAKDGKAAISALLKTVPTVETLNGGRSMAAE